MKTSDDTPCAALARIEQAAHAKGGTISREEWGKLWLTLHRIAAQSGRPCPCGDRSDGDDSGRALDKL